MSRQKIFSKRVNWQLYDVDNNKRVTLGDLRKMIVDGTDIRIVDEYSGDDVTVVSLLYIIIEKEKSIKPSTSAVLMA